MFAWNSSLAIYRLKKSLNSYQLISAPVVMEMSFFGRLLGFIELPVNLIIGRVILDGGQNLI